MGRSRTQLGDYSGALRDFREVLGLSGSKAEALAADRQALAIYQELGQADPASHENALHVTEVQKLIAALQAGG